jgi:hypothetical protein
VARENTGRRLAAILSAGVVGCSRLMGIDEVGTLGALRAHRAELIDRSPAVRDTSSCQSWICLREKDGPRPVSYVAAG